MPAPGRSPIQLTWLFQQAQRWGLQTPQLSRNRGSGGAPASGYARTGAQCSRRDPWDKLAGGMRGRKAFPVPEDQAPAGWPPSSAGQWGRRPVPGEGCERHSLWDPSPAHPHLPGTPTQGSRQQAPLCIPGACRASPRHTGPLRGRGGGCSSVCHPRSPSLRLHCSSWPVASWDAADPPLRGWGQGAVPGASTGPGHICAGTTVHARPASVPTCGSSATTRFPSSLVYNLSEPKRTGT